MTSSRFARPALALSLLASSCSIFHRHRDAPAPPPPVEATRSADTPTPPTAARDLADAMTTVLHLTPEQTTQARQVLNSTVRQANAARQEYPAASPELGAALKRINLASDKELRQVLGPAAYRDMQTKQAQIQAEMRK